MVGSAARDKVRTLPLHMNLDQLAKKREQELRVDCDKVIRAVKWSDSM